MAVRIDFFSVEPDVDLERVDLTSLVGDGAPPDTVARWEGYVSASDDDEGTLVELAGLWATHGILDGIGVQGVSEAAHAVAADDAAVLMDLDDTAIEGLSAGPTSASQVREWANVAGHCVAETVAGGRHIGWWTRFDGSGTVDAGPDEWSTGGSLRELG